MIRTGPDCNVVPWWEQVGDLRPLRAGAPSVTRQRGMYVQPRPPNDDRHVATSDVKSVVTA